MTLETHQDKVFNYLDELKASGKNEYAMAAYLREKFNISRPESLRLLELYNDKK